MAAHVREEPAWSKVKAAARVLPATLKPAVAGGTRRVEQHQPPTPPTDFSESEEEPNLTREIAEIAEAESSITFEREFKELMLEHARVMASMAEAMAKYAENAGGDPHILADRYEDAEKHITSTVHQIFENAVNGLSLPPTPSIERKACKKKAKVIGKVAVPVTETQPELNATRTAKARKKARKVELQDKTAEVAPTAKPAVTGEPVKRGGKIAVQWVGKVLSVEDKKGLIDGRSEHGGHDERCFFYPQDLVHTLKKGDQVRFYVDLNVKRRGHHYPKACKVVKEEANPQQARTKKAPGLYSQVAKTADARRIKSMETTIYELRRLLDASYRPQAPNGSRKWRGGWKW